MPGSWGYSWGGGAVPAGVTTLADGEEMIVRQLLIDLGLGVEASWSSAGAYVGARWPCFDSNEPDKPDDSITVYSTQGFDFGREQPGGSLASYGGFQVRVRSKNSSDGRAKAEAIRRALAEAVLDTVVHVGANAYIVHAVNRIGQVLRLGADVPGGKRRLFTINAAIDVRQGV